jgi:hypothetical protein
MSKVIMEAVNANTYQQDDFFDHFHNYDSSSKWNFLGGTSCTGALTATAAASSVTLTASGGATDREAQLYTLNKWIVKNVAPIQIDARLLSVEANTNTQALFIGLSNNTWASQSVFQNGGLLLVSASNVGIYKKSATLAFRGTCSIAGTVYGDTASDENNDASGTQFKSYRIIIAPQNSTVAKVTYLIDRTGGTNVRLLRDPATTGRPIIAHNLTYTSFVASNFGACVQYESGVGSNNEVSYLDLVRISQRIGAPAARWTNSGSTAYVPQWPATTEY